jgi:hypothetical protein
VVLVKQIQRWVERTAFVDGCAFKERVHLIDGAASLLSQGGESYWLRATALFYNVTKNLAL